MSKSKPSIRKYLATFLLDTRGFAEPVDNLVAKLRDAIIAVHGEIDKVENHGQRDFARPPSKAYPAGILVAFTFKGPVTAPAALREKVRLDPYINRVILQDA